MILSESMLRDESTVCWQCLVCKAPDHILFTIDKVWVSPLGLKCDGNSKQRTLHVQLGTQCVDSDERNGAIKRVHSEIAAVGA